MKLFTALSVVAGVGLAFSAMPASASNIVVNGGFETGTLDPWFNARDFSGGGTDWSVTNTAAHSGSFGATNLGNIELRQNFTATATSQITSASFWALQPAAAGTAYDLFYSDNTDDEFIVGESGSWQQIDFLSNLEVGKSLTGFSVFGCNPNLTSFVDDVNISTGPKSAVPEPSSTAAFTVGLLGLGALSIFARRRRSAN